MRDGILFKMTANYCKGILEGESLRDGKLYGPENLGKNPFPREETFFVSIAFFPHSSSKYLRLLD